MLAFFISTYVWKDGVWRIESYFRHVEDNDTEQDRDAGEDMLIEGMLGQSTGLVFPRAVGETTEAHVDTAYTLLCWAD